MPVKNRNQERWLVIMVLFSLVPFFQNMSPFDSSRIDIRAIAPDRPEGSWDSEYGRYFPKNYGQFLGLGDVGNALFEHNLDPIIKDFEDRYLTFSSGARGTLGPPEGSSAANAGLSKSPYRWSVGLLNSQKLRLMYEDSRWLGDLRFSVEIKNQANGSQFFLSRSLNENWGFGLSHQLEGRQSRLHLDYHW
jgi:hypothetical protein